VILRVDVWQGLRNVNDKDGRIVSDHAIAKYSGEAVSLFRLKVIILRLGQDKRATVHIASHRSLAPASHARRKSEATRGMVTAGEGRVATIAINDSNVANGNGWTCRKSV
jgi:hypothetical protein